GLYPFGNRTSLDRSESKKDRQLCSCRSLMPLEAEATLTSGFCKRFHAAVIDVRSTIKHNFLHARLDGALGEQLADSSSCCLVRTGLQAALEVSLEGRSSSKRHAARIVDDLRVDVL